MEKDKSARKEKSRIRQRFKKFNEVIEKDTVIGSIVYIALGAIVAITLYKGIGFALSTSDPMVTVIGNSMIPTLYNGDLVVLQGVNVSELEVGRGNGTIIVYPSPLDTSRPIIHRVYMINADGTLKTWGDNNAAPDPWNVDTKWIKGKVVLKIPFLGYPRIALRMLIGR